MNTSKEETRRLKNKEHAAESRRRAKERLAALHQKIAFLEHENATLRAQMIGAIEYHEEFLSSLQCLAEIV